MQSFIFVIKHIGGQAKTIADALSRRILVLRECQVQVLGFDHMNEMYKDDLDFKESIVPTTTPPLV
jgi:hypothetical protein